MVSLSMTLSDPEPSFKVTVVLKREYLENRAFYTQSYYGTVMETICKLSNGVTFDDLE